MNRFTQDPPRLPRATKRAASSARRRLLIASAAISLAAVALSGCSAGAPTASVDAKASPQTLTVWSYFSVGTQVAMMKRFASMFEKENPGVKVRDVYVPYDQMDSKLIAAAGAKTGPDVVLFNGGDAGAVESAGTLADISTQWKSFADRKEFPSSALHSLNGKLYAAQGYVSLLGLYYNKDLLQKLGLTVPTTLSQLNADLAKTQAAGDEGIALSGLPDSQGEFTAFPWLSEAGFTYSKPTKAAMTKGLGIVQNWVNKGYLPKEATVWDNTIPMQKWAAGNVLFCEGGNWLTSTAQTTAKFSWEAAPLPLGAAGPKVYLGGEAAGIGKYSKNPSLAWKYLKETLFTKAGELIALKDVGDIPARADAAASSVIAKDATLKAFAEEVTKYGATYPDAGVLPKSVDTQQLQVGQAWSSVISGTSPASATQTLFTTLPSLLKHK